MKYSELTKKLKRLGIEFRRQARGSHEIWWDPKTKRYTRITNHPGKEIKSGTFHQILSDLGLTEDDLNG